jgi:predicted O-methyltransferase YrrM
MNEEFLYERSWFDIKYRNQVGLRYPTTKAALNLLLQRGGGLIVETGTMRLLSNWGDGCSTLLYGDFCKRYGKRVVTVDISPENIAISKEATKDFSDCIEYVIDDSIKYLQKLSSQIKIDLIYLDSMDCPVVAKENDPSLVASQRHNLNEMKATMPHLHDGSIILLDDSGIINGGKSKETKKFLMEAGWVCVYDYYQSLWIRR